MSNQKPEDVAETERLERLIESYETAPDVMREARDGARRRAESFAVEGELLHAADPLVIRPGDVLVVTVRDHLSMSEVDSMAAAWRQHVPDAKLCVIDGVEQSYVYRPDATDA